MGGCMARRAELVLVGLALVAVGSVGCKEEKASDSAGCHPLAPELCDRDWGDPVSEGDAGSSGAGVHEIDGYAGVAIVELGCDLIWEMSGEQCSGCDLAWDVELENRYDGSCSFGADVDGRLETNSGAVYFNGDYWGASRYGDGHLEWQTAGYVYGTGGYTYAYFGEATLSGSGSTGGGSGGTDDLGDLEGTAGVLIAELGCVVIWDMAGDQCPGCDLGWDVDLDYDASASDCGFGGDGSGRFEVEGGGAYFNGDYWGAASSGGGSISWNTVGYMYGAAYAYVYAGMATY